MNVQSILLGIIIPILTGSLFHLWKGGPLWNLIVYIVTAEAGFWLGHLFAAFLKNQFGMIGPLQVFAGSIGAVAFMLLGRWLFINPKKISADGENL
ncbi:MAG TPA: hypothetical protein PKD55_07780 [Bellilinea sp.]|nr:hypothetical protein [Bellilinea sp.]